MGHHEKIWLDNFDNSKVLFCRRYVDDFFHFIFISFYDAPSVTDIRIKIFFTKNK